MSGIGVRALLVATALFALASLGLLWRATTRPPPSPAPAPTQPLLDVAPLVGMLLWLALTFWFRFYFFLFFFLLLWFSIRFVLTSDVVIAALNESLGELALVREELAAYVCVDALLFSFCSLV